MEFCRLPRAILFSCAIAGSFGTASVAGAAEFKTLHAFSGSPDGDRPETGLLLGADGGLYGTTLIGGQNDVGTIFKVARHDMESVLHSFAYGNAGERPGPGLVADDVGNLYGTDGGNGVNEGVVFKFAPDGTLSILHRFRGRKGGWDPNGPLLRDVSGNLYGTADIGGGADRIGTVFRIAPDGTFQVLYTFEGGPDGDYPFGGLVMDPMGNLYGGTWSSNSGGGVIYRLSPTSHRKWRETVLHTFQGGSDGTYSSGNLLLDSAGNIYGTTEFGGGSGCQNGYGCGIVFRLAPDGSETVIHNFLGGSDGNYPNAGLVQDERGNLYGTTQEGGSDNCLDLGCGTIFKIAASGEETVLHAFAETDGAFPAGPLVLQGKRTLYGTTSQDGGTGCGGNGCGTVFRLRM